MKIDFIFESNCIMINDLVNSAVQSSDVIRLLVSRKSQAEDAIKATLNYADKNKTSKIYPGLMCLAYQEKQALLAALRGEYNKDDDYSLNCPEFISEAGDPLDVTI